ncbi:MAG: hypothetical protein PVJ28_04245 [Acidimicrobiia bacterium]
MKLLRGEAANPVFLFGVLEIVETEPTQLLPRIGMQEDHHLFAQVDVDVFSGLAEHPPGQHLVAQLHLEVPGVEIEPQDSVVVAEGGEIGSLRLGSRLVPAFDDGRDPTRIGCYPGNVPIDRSGEMLAETGSFPVLGVRRDEDLGRVALPYQDLSPARRRARVPVGRELLPVDSVGRSPGALS